MTKTASAGSTPDSLGQHPDSLSVVQVAVVFVCVLCSSGSYYLSHMISSQIRDYVRADNWINGREGAEESAYELFSSV